MLYPSFLGRVAVHAGIELISFEETASFAGVEKVSSQSCDEQPH